MHIHCKLLAFVETNDFENSSFHSDVVSPSLHSTATVSFDIFTPRFDVGLCVGVGTGI